MMTAEVPPAQAASESNPAPAPEAATTPAPAPKVVAPIKKPRVAARAAPRYGWRYAERGPYAFVRQYGSYGGQDY